MKLDEARWRPALQQLRHSLQELNSLQRTLLEGISWDEEAADDERLAELHGISPGAIRLERVLVRRLLRQGIHDEVCRRRAEP